MDSVSVILLFSGVAVLAVAVIVLAIWVTVLSGRLKRMSDFMMLDSEELHRDRRIAQVRGRGSLGPSVSPDYEYDPNELGSGIRMRPSARGSVSQGNPRASQPSRPSVNGAYAQRPSAQPAVPSNAYATGPIGQSRQAQPPTGQQSQIPRNPALNQMAYDDGIDEDQAFFDSYREASEQRTSSFGRAKPSIPFGEDKDYAERRESYKREAVESDFDPDSIDFSRVEGYKHIRR